ERQDQRMNFFAELKRRNVYKVAVAYAVIAWLLIQAASIFFPAFDAPPWVMKIFIIVIIFGFPVALIFSWAFEITPEGIKLESEIEPSKSIKRRIGRKIVAVTIALAVVAAGLFVYQLVQPKVGTALRDVRSDSAKDEGRLGEPSLPAPNKSVAVLPFVNMSADKNDEYLSDGMTEELINVLSKMPGLRVPGRTSCFAFKGKNEEDIFRKVGDQLHVGTVLEGSVRKAGEKLRVTAQLINVSDGYHLWSKDYDGDFKDIFAFQSNVAKRVVEALQVPLRPLTSLAAPRWRLQGHICVSKQRGQARGRGAASEVRGRSGSRFGEESNRESGSTPPLSAGTLRVWQIQRSRLDQLDPLLRAGAETRSQLCFGLLRPRRHLRLHGRSGDAEQRGGS